MLFSLVLLFLVLVMFLIVGGFMFAGGLRLITLGVGFILLTVGVVGVGSDKVGVLGILFIHSCCGGFGLLVGGGFVAVLVGCGCGFCCVNVEISLCTLLVPTPVLVSLSCCFFGAVLLFKFLFLVLFIAFSTTDAPTQGGLGWGPN